MNFFKKLSKKEKSKESSDTAKERLHLVLMQDRANVSADFLELMKQEIIEVIKKYIDVDEAAIDVKLTNKANEDGTVGAPALYANIPIITIKNDARKMNTPKVEESSSNSENKTGEKVSQKAKDDTVEKTTLKMDDKKIEENKKENVAQNKQKNDKITEKQEEIINEKENLQQSQKEKQSVKEEKNETKSEQESNEAPTEEQKAEEQANS
ncbi:MAG: cell division topological specificity factor MinE [Clostridia bacterium]|nr:cell division topological specificity factor MinE [Clostridia bacterium]